MTVQDNDQLKGLIFENIAPTDKMVDIRKVSKKEVKDQEPVLEKEQFVLVGFSTTSILKKTIKDEVQVIQLKLMNLSKEIFSHMAENPDDTADLADVHMELARLLTVCEKVKKTI